MRERSLKRRHLIFYLRVFDAKQDRLLGNVVDITVEGLKLICEKPLEMGQTFSLAMDLPGEPSEREHITFTARSVWVRQDVNPAFWVVGLQMIQIDQAARDIIEALIHQMGFED